jgi:regulator of replication initiation timing
MSKALSMFILTLVLLGFLISTTVNMFGDMQQLTTENQKLSSEVTQLHANYETLVQERDTLKAENTELRTKLDAVQKVYVIENQARIKAESDVATYKKMMTNMVNNVQTLSPSICTQTEQQASYFGKVLSSDIVPLGAGSLVTLSIAILIVIRINHHRRHKK